MYLIFYLFVIILFSKCIFSLVLLKYSLSALNAALLTYPFWILLWYKIFWIFPISSSFIYSKHLRSKLYLSAHCPRVRRNFYLVFFWRNSIHQVGDKIIPETSHDVITVGSVNVAGIWQNNHIQILVCLYQCVNHQISFIRRHVCNDSVMNN